MRCCDGKAHRILGIHARDAALSAASYLCAHGRDLTTAQGWTDAIYSYNQSDSYLRQVRDQATAYAAKTGTAG